MNLDSILYCCISTIDFQKPTLGIWNLHQMFLNLFTIPSKYFIKPNKTHLTFPFVLKNILNILNQIKLLYLQSLNLLLFIGLPIKLLLLNFPWILCLGMILSRPPYIYLILSFLIIYLSIIEFLFFYFKPKWSYHLLKQ